MSAHEHAEAIRATIWKDRNSPESRRSAEAALAALVAENERLTGELDRALDLAEKSWAAAWAKARREWESNVTVKLPAAEARAEAAEAENARLRERAEEHIARCEQAAENWRTTASEQRRDGDRSEMSGESNIPSHVLSTARAMMWEAAAESARAALVSPAPEEQPEP